MSCNGCRVLRKGCSDSCILRSSLQWIDSPESQGHATVFVAKFFGRAGMISFINAVSESQRPALFQSLLYEACGRTVNPVFGAVGLLWSGNWSVCQSAVETVLKGGTLKPATQCLPSSINPTSKPPPMSPCIYNTTNQGVSSPSKPSVIHPGSESMAQIEAHNKMPASTSTSTSTTTTTANATATPTPTPTPTTTTATPPLGAAACETPPSHPTLLMKRPYMLPITSTTTTTTPLPPPKRPKSCPSRPRPEDVDPPSANGSPTIGHTFEQREICSPPEQEEGRAHPPHPIGGGQLIAPIPRRVRMMMPMMEHHHETMVVVSSNCMPVSSSCETPPSSEEDMEVSTMHLVESMSKENMQGRVELNLSLNNFHGVMMRSKVYTHGGSSPPHDEGQNRVSSPLTGNNRVSSPCSFSVNSEGSSLTSLDSVEFSMACWPSQQEGLHHHHHHHLEERQLLNLL